MSTQLQKDPVCWMEVDPSSPPGGSAVYRGQTFYFCADSCRQEFVTHPEQYTDGRSPADRAKDRGLPQDIEYTCPMHPEIVQVGFGTCPLCGMALEPKTVTLETGENPELTEMRRRFWMGAPATAILLAAMFVPISGWIQAALATWAMFVGKPIFERAWNSLRMRSPNMFTLIGLGTLAAYFQSLALLAQGHEHFYFESAGVIITLVLLGQVLELRARAQTQSALQALLKLTPTRVTRVTNAGDSEVDLAEVQVGDSLRLKPGERVAVDGEVVDGVSAVDESSFTGEPLPVGKKAGDPVLAGTLNTTGALVYRASKVGRETLLARIIQQVAEAQRSKPPLQRLADRMSAIFVPAVVGAAVVSGFIWLALGSGFAPALEIAVAVVIIACPCALGLATPMSVLVASGRGARQGILFRDASAFELLERVDTVVFDKTGTLTEGRPRVADIRAEKPAAATRALALAAAVESQSEHPLARAVVSEAKIRGLPFRPAEAFESVPGEGASGVVAKQLVYVGKPKWVAEKVGANAISSDFPNLDASRPELGATEIHVAVDGRVIASILLEDTLRPDARDAITALKKHGIQVTLLTGDREEAARRVAAQIGIDEVHAGVSPSGKAEFIKKLKAQGRVVAMAGDGVNDSVALTAADVGIAMGGGSDAALGAAQVTLLNGGLRGVLGAIELGRETLSNMRQNLALAFGYNLLAIPIAAGALYPFTGWLLSPMLASAAMSLSSVSVITNALRLRRRA